MEDQYRAVIDIFLSGGASCVFHTMDEEDVENILATRWSRSRPTAACASSASAQPHPRGYGTNARVLGRYVRERERDHAGGRRAQDDLAARDRVPLHTTAGCCGRGTSPT